MLRPTPRLPFQTEATSAEALLDHAGMETTNTVKASIQDHIRGATGKAEANAAYTSQAAANGVHEFVEWVLWLCQPLHTIHSS